MKNILASLVIVVLVLSCNNKKGIPDVSGIKVDLTLERFEKDFFAIDTNNVVPGLTQLQQKYPGFYRDFMQGVIGISGIPADPPTQEAVRRMLSSYTSLYKVVEAKLGNATDIESQLKKGFQFVKYYFPNYKVPGVITFIGTLDIAGTVLTENYVAVGLHQYAGKNFEGYKSPEVMQLYPSYITRRFEPQYIPANCMKAIVSDLFPDKSVSRPLSEQMIEKGKQWWLLDMFLPEMADSLKTGYTQQQLEWCEANEGLIWSYIVKNDELHSVNPVTIQTYIGEAPFTAAFSQELSPGNIGQWIGWQIVKKYAKDNPKMKIDQIMQADPKKILEEARYKPR